MSKNVKSDGAITPDEVLLQPPSAQQEAVIAALLEGKTQREAAALAGLAEETISRWKRNDPVFLAALNQRRDEAWALHLDAARKLKQKAVEALSELLDSDDDATRLKAAAVAVRIDLTPPDGPTALETAIIHQARYMTLDDAREQAKIERAKIEGAQKSELMLAALQRMGPGSVWG